MRPLFNVLAFVLFQLLAGHFEWFQDAFDKMTKDGRETQWRQITEHEKPELVALPDGLDEKYVENTKERILRWVKAKMRS